MRKIRSAMARIVPLLRFHDSKSYWEKRYKMGGNSGDGSAGANAEHKARVINQFIHTHDVESVLEFGCGDGRQLALLRVPQYTGVDVSQTIIDRCNHIYADAPGKRFVILDEYLGEKAQLAMSIDVIFHLVEQSVYEAYLHALFDAATDFVLIYSTDVDMATTGVSHVRHRHVSAEVARQYPIFERMHDFEATLEPPVRFDRGHPTIFMAYKRQ